MGKQAHIYGLVDPRTQEVRYVGKSDDLERRRKQHISMAKKRDKPEDRWIRELLDLGLKPEIVPILEVLTCEWEPYEIATIKEYRDAGHRLFNVHPGGNQPPYDVPYVRTEEIRKRLSDSIKRLWEDPEWAKHQLEQYADESRRQAISDGVKAHWEDPEAREQHINSLLEAWNDEERRQWLSDFNRERAKDPEFREKQSAALKQSFKDNPELGIEISERLKAWSEQNPDIVVGNVERMNRARLEWLETEEGKEAWRGVSENISRILKEKWADPEFKRQQMEHRKKVQSENRERLKDDPEWLARQAEKRNNQAEAARRRWANPEYRARQREACEAKRGQ